MWCSGGLQMHVARLGEGACWGVGCQHRAWRRKQPGCCTHGQAETQPTGYSAAPPRAEVQDYIHLSKGTLCCRTHLGRVPAGDSAKKMHPLSAIWLPESQKNDSLKVAEIHTPQQALFNQCRGESPKLCMWCVTVAVLADRTSSGIPFSKPLGQDDRMTDSD